MIISLVGVIGTDGSIWREHRRFQLTTLRDFGMGKVKLESAIQGELETLISEIDQKNGQPFQFTNLITTTICNIITTILFGKQYEHNDPKLALLVRLLSQNFENIPTLNNTVSEMPWLRFLPGDLFKYWQTVGNLQTVEASIRDEINSHKMSYRRDVTRDFVDAYLHHQEDDKDKADSTFTGEDSTYYDS